MRCLTKLVALLFGFLSVSVLAQINTGRVSGFITDATGAAVAGVSVSAISDSTGIISRSESSEVGEYLVNFLLPGTYRIEVSKEGFRKSVQSQVTVNAGSATRVDFELKVGQVVESVDVAMNPIAVSTETSELSQTFSHKELDNLPNIDRNPLYQLNLMPGANNDAGSGNYGTNGGENGSAVGQTRPQLASIGGIDANANTVYIEGIFNREPQNAYIGVTPPIEGIQEVRVYTGKYNAEFGFSGSAVVNIVTKSGGNQFHGALFEYLRNEATDAKNYFTQAGDQTQFQRNQFGAAVGGPVLKDKLFFFADYQGTTFHKSNPNDTTVPTEKMITGDFSELYDASHAPDNAGNTWGQIYDPFTRVFDSNGNVVSATPFAGNIIPSDRWDSVAAAMNQARIFGSPNRPGLTNNLHYLSRNVQTAHQADGRLDFVRTTRDRLFFRYSILDATNDNSTNVNQFFQDGNADSKTFNQNLQISDLFNFSSSKMNELRLGYNRTNVTTSNKALGKDWSNSFGLPNGNLGDAATGMVEFSSLEPVHNIATPDWIGYIVSNTISLTDNFTWIKGRHSIKFGGNLNHVEDTSADTIGGDDPRRSLSFDPAMTSFDGPAQPYAYPSFLLGTMTQSARARFVAGAPYQTYWQNAWYAQDDFRITPSLTVNLGLRYDLFSRPIERDNHQSNWDVRTNQLVVATDGNRSPSMNLDKNDWGPRLGFAWSPDHGRTSIRGGYGISYWQAYWSGPLTILGLGYPSYAKQALTTPNNLTPGLQLSVDGLPLAQAEYDSSGNLIIPASAVIRGADVNWKNQRVDQKTLNVEREIRPGMIVDVGYLGVRGRHNNHSRNINLATPSANSAEDFNLRRPLYSTYPQLGDLPISFSEADSYYDALTARFAATVNKYIYVNASYAHGRSFSNGNNLDLANINQYYGPTQQDIAHIFNSQMTFDVPICKGKAVWGEMNRVLDAIIGGWQYAGLLHLRSGTRFDVTSGLSLLNNGQGNRADRVGNGQISNPSVQHWFDTTAFVDHTVAGTYGNAGINPLRADDQVQLDSSISKVFRLTERQQVQFRADLFNTFNHPDFSAPDALVGSATEGEVFSTSIDNRRFQFSLRYSF